MRLFIVFLIIFGVCGFGVADDLTIPDDLLIAIYDLEGGQKFLEDVLEKAELLELALEQIEEDQDEIDGLRIARDEARQEAWDRTQEITAIKNELRTTKGLYFGGVVGYPFVTVLGVLEYRFQRWSPIIIGGYSKRPFISVGVNVRVGQ